MNVNVAHSIETALASLDEAAGEVVLDFSGVSRISPATVAALEKLAARVGEKSFLIACTRVNPDVYKVLKLVKLAPRFSFPSV